MAAHGAVVGLRQAGFRGEIVLAGREPHPPYERPYLSKRYLLHEVPREHLFLPPLDAELRLGEEVVELDPDGHAVRLAGEAGLAEAHDRAVRRHAGSDHDDAVRCAQRCRSWISE